MPQSDVPDCIARLDDARYKLERVLQDCLENGLTREGSILRNLAGALEQVQLVIKADPFKASLSDQASLSGQAIANFSDRLGADIGGFIKKLPSRSGQVPISPEKYPEKHPEKYP